MLDKALPTSATFAALLWSVGLVFVFMDMFTEFNSGDLGIVTCCGGCVMNVRSFLCDLAYREKNAFHLGRDSARMESKR